MDKTRTSLNIALFTDFYGPPTYGTETCIRTFSRELSRREHTVWVIAPGADGRMDIHQENVRLRVVRMPSTGLLFGRNVRLIRVGGIRSLLRYLRRVKVDLVHTDGVLPLGLLGALVARYYTVPLVHTFRTDVAAYAGYVPWFRKVLQNIVRRLVKGYCRRCDLVVCPCESAQRYLRDDPSMRDRTILIHDAVDSPFAAALREAHGTRTECRRRVEQFHDLPEKRKLLLYTGRLVPEKNIPFLLDVTRSLLDRGVPVVLLLVGDGFLRRSLEEHAMAMGLREAIRCVGFVSKEALPAYYAAADCFVFASTTETSGGGALLEALTAGTPCVVMKGPGVSDTLWKYREVFEVASSEEFLSKVHRLLEDSMLWRIRSGQAEEIGRHFSMVQTMDHFLECYGEMLGGWEGPR